MPDAYGPSPETPYPMRGIKRLCFLKNFVTRPNILVGDYTYYDDPDGPENFERNVLYHFDFLGDRLIIGKFCAVAAGAKFIMNGGNHFMAGFTPIPSHSLETAGTRRCRSCRISPSKATRWWAMTSGSATTACSCPA